MPSPLDKEVESLKGISERTKDLMSSASSQIDELREATAKSAKFEQLRLEFIKKGSFDRAQSVKKLIDEYQVVIDSNSDLQDMLQIEANMRQEKADESMKVAEELANMNQQVADDDVQAQKEASSRLLALGDDTSILGKATRALDDQFNTLKDSTGILGDMLENMSNSSRKMALSFSVSAGMLGTVANKYATSLLESATFLPNAIQGAGLIESSVFMGTMMAKTGLDLEQLTTQMKSNRIAWQTNGKQISEFIGDNEALRLKLGETREGFAEMAARATNFLSARGVEQKNLASETTKYIVNLERLAIQSGRQASEVEAARRAAKQDKGRFLLQFGGATRDAMESMVQSLSDQMGGSNGIAQMFSNVLDEADPASRMAAQADASVAIRDIAIRAGVAASSVDELLRAQMGVLRGDESAAARAVELSNQIGTAINKFAISGSLVDERLGRAIRPVGDIILDAASAYKHGLEQGGDFSQLTKASETTVKALVESTTPMGDLLATLSSFRGTLGAVGGDITTTLLGFGSALPGFIEVGKQIPMMGASMKRFALGIDKDGKKSKGMIGKFLGFLGPIGMALGAIAIIAPLIVANWDEIVGFLKGAGEEFSKVFDKVKDTFKNMFPNASKFLSEWIISPVKQFFGDIFGGDKSGNFFQDWVKTPLSNLFGSIFNTDSSTFMSEWIISPVKQFFGDIFGGDKSGNFFQDWVLAPVSAIFNKIFAVDYPSLLNDWLITPTKTFFDGIFGGEKTGNFFQDWVVAPLTNYFGFVFGNVSTASNFLADNLVNPLVEWFGNMFGFDTSNFDLGTLIKVQVFDRIRDFIGVLGDFIASFTSLDGLKNIVSGGISSVFSSADEKAIVNNKETTQISPTKEQPVQESNIDDLLTRKEGIERIINTGSLPEAALNGMLQTLNTINMSIQKQQMNSPDIVVQSPGLNVGSPVSPQAAQMTETQTVSMPPPANDVSEIIQPSITNLQPIGIEPQQPLTVESQSALQVESQKPLNVMVPTLEIVPTTIGIEPQQPLTVEVPNITSPVIEPPIVQSMQPTTIAEPNRVNQPTKIQRLEADIQKVNKRSQTLVEKSKTTKLTDDEKKEVKSASLDKFIMEGILKQLKELNAVTRTSVAIQDSINAKQERLVRAS